MTEPAFYPYCSRRGHIVRVNDSGNPCAACVAEDKANVQADVEVIRAIASRRAATYAAEVKAAEDLLAAQADEAASEKSVEAAREKLAAATSSADVPRSALRTIPPMPKGMTEKT